MSEQINQPEAPLTAEQVLSAGSELLERFGVKVDPETRLPVAGRDEFIQAMDQLNPRFQGERPLVRFELEDDQTQWSEADKALIMQAAESMRMLKEETPLEGRFDLVVVLGAARQAPADRARYAVQASFEKADFNQLLGVGSERPLGDAEKENAASYAPGAEIEADLTKAAVTSVAVNENQRLAADRGAFPKIVHFNHMTVEGERAGTPDVIEKVMSEVRERAKKMNREIPASFRLGAVTTQIYQTATALDVARTAQKFGITETAVGGNPSDPAIVARRTPATYLSEVLRTLKAAAWAYDGFER